MTMVSARRMRNWRKTAWWTLGVLATLALLCMIAAHTLFDKAHVIEMAQRRVKATIGRDIGFGDLSLQLFPFPALVARRVTLSNPAWARNRNLLEADVFTAHLDLPALLSGQVAVSKVSIEGMKANPEVAADNRKSWDFSTNETSRPRPSKAFNPQRLTALHIRNLGIRYVSGGVQRKPWQVDEINLRGQPGWRNVALDARIARNGRTFKLKGQFADLSGLGVKGAATDGALWMNWGDAQLSLAGRLPLEPNLEGLVLKTDFQSQSMTELLEFFAIKNGAVAPIKAHAELRTQQGWIDAAGLDIRMGELTISGDAKFKLSGARPVFDARLSADRLDWERVMSDAGRPPLPPKPEDELFHTNPLAWPLLAAMENIDGAAEVRVRSLKLRSGVEIKEARARMAFKGDRVHVNQFSGNLLGGSASGNAILEGRRKSIRLNLDATDISLGEWLAEREKRIALTGGPMKINAAVNASGSSIKELAASLTGPVSIRVGHAKMQSRQIQQAESLLIGLAPMLSAKDSDQVDLTCAAARMNFVAGRAEATPIVAARSDVSQILTSGYIDLREQTLDLRGRIRARSGVNLGVATLAGEVKIAGKILRPEVGLDPAGAPGVLARLGAAIATGGASLLVTSIWDAANPASDPCQIVLAAPAKPAPRDNPPSQNGPPQ